MNLVELRRADKEFLTLCSALIASAQGEDTKILCATEESAKRLRAGLERIKNNPAYQRLAGPGSISVEVLP